MASAPPDPWLALLALGALLATPVLIYLALRAMGSGNPKALFAVFLLLAVLVAAAVLLL